MSKSERILNAIAKRTGLTEAGKNWLMAAVDPFHDNQFKVDGFPDPTSSPSIVQCVKQSMTLKVPASVGATANWDCMIVAYPWLNFIPVNGENDFPGFGQTTFTSGSPTTSQAGGLMAYSDTAGTDLGPDNTAIANITSISLPNNYWLGKHRIIAMGFEVHNVTADINKQGTATVWKNPVPDFEAASTRVRFTNTTGGNYMTANVLTMPLPPQRLSQALILPGSRQWDAREGAYVTSTFNDLHIPTDLDNSVSFRLTSPLLTNFSINETVNSLPTATTTFGSFAYKCWSKCDMSGVTFTGLSNASSLTVTWNVYVERFPDISEADLVVLAYPSPAYDPVALELYTHIMNDMPVGVMVKENGLGDWFAGAVQKASSLIGPALSMMPHPAAKAAGAAMSLIAPGNSYENSNGKTGIVQRAKAAVHNKVKQVSKAVANSKGKKK